MGQSNQCCQSPFGDYKKFDLNEVKIYWPEVAQQISILRKLNSHQISLKTNQPKISSIKQNHHPKTSKKIYKQLITSSHCFFGYISHDQNGSNMQCQQTPSKPEILNKQNSKNPRSSIKNKQNLSYLSFLPSVYKLNHFAILIQKQKACYMGNFKDKLYHGKGKLYSLEMNDSFDGIFEYGQRVNGKYENNEFKYTGTFKNNQLSGKGKLQYKNTNDIYDGEIHRGKMHGKGKIVYSNGDIYEGQFFNGFYHGEGIYCWSSGEIYKGAYKKGIKHGFGIMTIQGKSHQICWVNGKAEGKPINYQQFQLKSKIQTKTPKTRQDLTKQNQFKDDQDEATSIIQRNLRVVKTQSYLY